MVGASAAIATTTQLALTLTSFRLIWNVPSQACQKDFGIALPLSPYGIEENVGQEFVGETIALFYNLGEFPRLIKEANGSYTSVNGGIPQLANLTAHLESILHDLSSSLPENFSGLWLSHNSYITLHCSITIVIVNTRTAYNNSIIVSNTTPHHYSMTVKNTFSLLVLLNRMSPSLMLNSID